MKQSTILEIIAKLNERYTAEEVAKIYDLDLAEVVKVETAAVESGALKRPRTKDDRKRRNDAILKYVKEHPDESYAAVGNVFKVSGSLIAHVLSNEGQLRRQPSTQEKAGNMRMLALWVGGLTPSEVAATLEVSRQAVDNAIKRAEEAGLVDAIRDAVKHQRQLVRPRKSAK